MDLWQGKHSVSNYAIDFCNLAADNGLNSSSFDTYLHGLAEPIKDRLVPLELPLDFDLSDFSDH